MSPGTTQNDMITKAEIMEKAALKIDLSTFPAEDVSKKYLETMRFALRKQDKIKAYFEPHGDEMLNRIKESLTRYFSADRSDFPEGLRDIESDYNQLPGEPYPTIAINDTGNPERMIEFYVTGKQYDVYHVAFKGFTKS